jgi:hypothetical protein
MTSNWKLIEETRRAIEVTQHELERTQELLQTQYSLPAQWSSKESQETEWQPLEETHSNTLENLFDAKVISAVYTLNQVQFEVNFAAMTLRRVDNNSIVLIKRTLLTNGT